MISQKIGVSISSTKMSDFMSNKNQWVPQPGNAINIDLGITESADFTVSAQFDGN